MISTAGQEEDVAERPAGAWPRADGAPHPARPAGAEIGDQAKPEKVGNMASWTRRRTKTLRRRAEIRGAEAIGSRSGATSAR